MKETEDNWEDLGWIKLYRKSIQSRIFKNPHGWKVWCWILMKAQHSKKPSWVGIQTGKGTTSVRVFQGQFIYGKKSAVKELEMPGSTIDYWMKKLESSEFDMIIRHPTKNFTIIQVKNWNKHQGIQYTHQLYTNCTPIDTDNKAYNDYNAEKPTPLDPTTPALETLKKDLPKMTYESTSLKEEDISLNFFNETL
jgi:hypothetical protein